MHWPDSKTNKHKLSLVEHVLVSFKQCGILTSVDSGEPVKFPFKLRDSK